MNKWTKQTEDKAAKQKQSNVLIEKKVSFLGQWYSTGHDDSACQVWRNQISSTTAGTKNKLKITEAGITFGSKANFFNRSSDVLKLEDIHDFYIGDQHLYIIVCVARVTHTKQRILLFRCHNLKDCEDLVTVYRNLVDSGIRTVPSSHQGHRSVTSGGDIDYRVEVREHRLGAPENRSVDVIPDYEERYHHHSEQSGPQDSYYRYGDGHSPAGGGNQQSHIFREERSTSGIVTQNHANNQHAGERLAVPVIKQQGPIYSRVEHVDGARENMGARQGKHTSTRHYNDSQHHRESRQHQQQHVHRTGRVTSSSDDEARQVIDHFDRVVERSASSTSRDSPKMVRKPVQTGGEVVEKTLEVRRYHNKHDSSDDDYQARRKQEQMEKMTLAEQAKLRDEVENLKEQVEQLKFASLQRNTQPQQTVTETTTPSSHHSRAKRHGEKKRKHRRHKKSDTSSATDSSASSSDEVTQVKAKEVSSMEVAKSNVDDHHKLMVTHHTLDRHGQMNQVETFGNYDTRPPPPLPLAEATATGGQRVTKSAYSKVIKTSTSGGGNTGQIVSSGSGGAAVKGKSLKLVSSTGGPTYDCQGNPLSPESSTYSHAMYGGGTMGSSGYVSSTYGTTDRSGTGLRVVSASGATAIDSEGRLINDGASARSVQSTSSYQYAGSNGHGDHVIHTDGDPYANHLVYGGSTLKRDGGGSQYGGSNYHTTERHYSERVMSPPRIEVTPPHPTLLTPKKAASEYGYHFHRDEPDYGHSGNKVHKVTRHTSSTITRPAERGYVQRTPASSRNVVYYVDGHPSPPPQQHVVVETAPIYASSGGYESRFMSRSSGSPRRH